MRQKARFIGPTSTVLAYLDRILWSSRRAEILLSDKYLQSLNVNLEHAIQVAKVDPWKQK
jgi:hypothetical protein